MLAANRERVRWEWASRQRTVRILGDQNTFPSIEETLQASHGIRLHFDSRGFGLE